MFGKRSAATATQDYGQRQRRAAIVLFRSGKPTNARPLSIFGFELRVPNAASRMHADLVLELGREHLFNREIEPIERSFKTSKDVRWVSARGKARLDLFAQLEVFFQRGD